jgi:nucleoside-diphosphate-sugar epimerase
VINDAVNFTVNTLESATKEPSIKRFVLTSSSSAAFQGIFNKPYDMTPETWNTKAHDIAWAPPPYEPTQERMLYVYMESKVASEKAMWNLWKSASRTSKPTPFSQTL